MGSLRTQIPGIELGTHAKFSYFLSIQPEFPLLPLVRTQLLSKEIDLHSQAAFDRTFARKKEVWLEQSYSLLLRSFYQARERE